MKKIRISREVRRHLAPHFRADTPGSKFYAASPDELLREAEELFADRFREAMPDPDGRIRLSLRFPRFIGMSNVVAVSDLTPEEKSTIREIDRNGRYARVAQCSRVIPTDEFQIVLSPGGNLITMFPGVAAPPLPSSSDEPSPFWETHVFIQ